MCITGLYGVIINILMIYILFEKHKIANINVRSSLILCLSDLFQSIGVIIAALLIWYDPNLFAIADPICTLIFSVIIIFITMNVVKDAVSLFMESNLLNINLSNIRNELIKLKHVINCHDLHVWNLSLNKISASVHLLVSSESTSSESICIECILKNASKMLQIKFGIAHTTIQIEWPHYSGFLNKNYYSSPPTYCDHATYNAADYYHDDKYTNYNSLTASPAIIHITPKKLMINE